MGLSVSWSLGLLFILGDFQHTEHIDAQGSVMLLYLRGYDSKQ
jgi:hypothetical protein